MYIIARSHAVLHIPSPKFIHTKDQSRLMLTSKQKEALDIVYATDPYPNALLKNKLSNELKLERGKVDRWFENKRSYYKHCSGKMVCCSSLAWYIHVAICIVKYALVVYNPYCIMQCFTFSWVSLWFVQLKFRDMILLLTKTRAILYV